MIEWFLQTCILLINASYPSPSYAYLWLVKKYVIPAGMYASQIWATPYLQHGIEMDNSIQKWLLRSMLGVRTSTPSWSILREREIG
eukprot:1137396-Pelagomonas_calceolata.AAC.1